jgi:hypothetical protein
MIELVDKIYNHVDVDAHIHDYIVVDDYVYLHVVVGQAHILRTS